MKKILVAILSASLLCFFVEVAVAQISVFIAVGDVRPELREGRTINAGTTVRTGSDGLVVLEEQWPAYSADEADNGNCVRWIIISGGGEHRVQSRRGSECNPRGNFDASIQRAMSLQREVSTLIAFVGAGGKADGGNSIEDVRARFTPLQSLSAGPENGEYTIRQVSTGRYLDAHEYDGRDWGLVTRARQDNPTQRWIVRKAGSNTYTIRQGSNGRFVDAHEYDARDWALVTRTRQNNDTQRWIFRRVSGNVYTIQQESNGRFVDAHVTEDRDYAVVTRPRQDNDTQRWILARP